MSETPSKPGKGEKHLTSSRKFSEKKRERVDDAVRVHSLGRSLTPAGLTLRQYEIQGKYPIEEIPTGTEARNYAIEKLRDPGVEYLFDEIEEYKPSGRN